MVGGILDNNTSGRFIYDTLLNCKNSRIIALTGTPIQKDQYELGLLANILRESLFAAFTRNKKIKMVQK